MSDAEIVETEGVLGGKPRLKNHRISVLDVAEHADLGQSVEEIAERLDVTPGEVRAALAYRDAYPEEIAEQAERREEIHRELRERSRLVREA